MLYAVFLASLGTIAGMLVFAFWQAKRAASSADDCLSAVRKSGELELQVAAQGRAVVDRDKAITALEAERTRLESALDVVTKQRDEMVAKMSPKDSHAAVDAIRDALAPAVPGSVLPHVPAAAPPGAAPHR